jgi:hypothetical protein
MVVEFYSSWVETGRFVLLLEVETEKLCKANERMAEDILSIRIVDFQSKAAFYSHMRRLGNRSRSNDVVSDPAEVIASVMCEYAQ